MRGRTLNDSFIILDEAQNTNAEQMKMFTTRLGFNSKMVVPGDLTQRPSGVALGLADAERVLGTSTTCRFAAFRKDVCAPLPRCRNRCRS